MGDAVARRRRRGVHRRVDDRADHVREGAARPGRPHLGHGAVDRRARLPGRRRDAARARRRGRARPAARAARRRHADDERLHGRARARRGRAAARPAGDDVLGLARHGSPSSIRRSRCGPTTGSSTAARSSRRPASRPGSTWRSTSSRGSTRSSGARGAPLHPVRPRAAGAEQDREDWARPRGGDRGVATRERCGQTPGSTSTRSDRRASQLRRPRDRRRPRRRARSASASDRRDEDRPRLDGRRDDERDRERDRGAEREGDPGRHARRRPAAPATSTSSMPCSVSSCAASASWAVSCSATSRASAGVEPLALVVRRELVDLRGRVGGELRASPPPPARAAPRARRRPPPRSRRRGRGRL